MKARLVVEYKGKRYRVTRNGQCSSRRDCSLFERGVCDDPDRLDDFPCKRLLYAFTDVRIFYPTGCFKEIK